MDFVVALILICNKIINSWNVYRCKLKNDVISTWCNKARVQTSKPLELKSIFRQIVSPKAAENYFREKKV